MPEPTDFRFPHRTDARGVRRLSMRLFEVNTNAVFQTLAISWLRLFPIRRTMRLFSFPFTKMEMALRTQNAYYAALMPLKAGNSKTILRAGNGLGFPSGPIPAATNGKINGGLGYLL